MTAAFHNTQSYAPGASGKHSGLYDTSKKDIRQTEKMKNWYIIKGSIHERSVQKWQLSTCMLVFPF